MEPGHARVLNTCPSRPCDRPSDGSPEVMFDRVILTNIRHRRAAAAPTSARGRAHLLLLEDDFFFLAAPFDDAGFFLGARFGRRFGKFSLRSRPAARTASSYASAAALSLS